MLVKSGYSFDSEQKPFKLLSVDELVVDDDNNTESAIFFGRTANISSLNNDCKFLFNVCRFTSSLRSLNRCLIEFDDDGGVEDVENGDDNGSDSGGGNGNENLSEDQGNENSSDVEEPQHEPSNNVESIVSSAFTINYPIISYSTILVLIIPAI